MTTGGCTKMDWWVDGICSLTKLTCLEKVIRLTMCNGDPNDLVRLEGLGQSQSYMCPEEEKHWRLQGSEGS